MAVVPACVPVPDLGRCAILFEDEDDLFALDAKRDLYPLAERGV